LSQVHTPILNYTFNVGDINVKGNTNPEEIESRVKKGMKDAVTEALEGTRREIDQNQLIDVGE